MTRHRTIQEAAASTFNRMKNNRVTISHREPLALVVSLAIESETSRSCNRGQMCCARIQADIKVAFREQCGRLVDIEYSCRIYPLAPGRDQLFAHFVFRFAAYNYYLTIYFSY